MNVFAATTLATHARACNEARAVAALIVRLDDGEPYDEGSTLEADILAHCRVYGDFTWTDARGCVTCFGDVEGRVR